jgi:hypothetical protein
VHEDVRDRGVDIQDALLTILNATDIEMCVSVVSVHGSLLSILCPRQVFWNLVMYS